MSRLRPGPRTYKVFISHLYDDDEIYGQLRRGLNQAPRFGWRNLSVQVDKQLQTASVMGTKRSLTNLIKQADVLLAFAHSTSTYVNHELDKAEEYGVPVIAILDPARLQEKYRRSRSQRVIAIAKVQIPLDQPDQIVEAIRRFARPQRGPAIASDEMLWTSGEGTSEAIATPAELAQRMSQKQERPSFISRLGALFFPRSGTASIRNRDD